MSPRAEAVKKERDALLMRSALCRLRLHRGAIEARSYTAWRPASAARTPSATARLGFRLALSLVGVTRGARLIGLASRVVRLARVAGAVAGFARHAGWFATAQTGPARTSDPPPSPIGSAP